MKLSEYFLPYQKRWILDDARMKLYAKSRRIGITYATSFRVNDKCLRKPGTVQWVTSRDEFTAREFITDYIAKWAAAANAVCRGLAGENAAVVDPLHGIRAYTAEYGNGSRVISLSSTPEAFAGKGGDILIDEADLHAVSPENRARHLQFVRDLSRGHDQLHRNCRPSGGRRRTRPFRPRI